MKTRMTKQEHRKRHVRLHDAVDELAADYMNVTGNLMSKTTVMELCEWSYKQTKEPETINGQKHSAEPEIAPDPHSEKTVKLIRSFNSPTTIVSKKLLKQLKNDRKVSSAREIILILGENNDISTMPAKIIDTLAEHDFIRDSGDGYKLTAGGHSLRATLINPLNHNDKESIKRLNKAFRE